MKGSPEYMQNQTWLEFLKTVLFVVVFMLFVLFCILFFWYVIISSVKSALTNHHRALKMFIQIQYKHRQW